MPRVAKRRPKKRRPMVRAGRARSAPSREISKWRVPVKADCWTYVFVEAATMTEATIKVQRILSRGHAAVALGIVGDADAVVCTEARAAEGDARISTYTCLRCGVESLKADWGPGRVRCPACRLLAPSAEEQIGLPKPVAEIRWNRFNGVVQDLWTGDVDRAATDRERASRGMTVPWMPEMAMPSNWTWAERDDHENLGRWSAALRRAQGRCSLSIVRMFPKAAGRETIWCLEDQPTVEEYPLTDESADEIGALVSVVARATGRYAIRLTPITDGICVPRLPVVVVAAREGSA